MADTSLQVSDPTSQLSKTQGFGPQTFDQALIFADKLAKSTLIPKDYQSRPENILVAIQHGAELGLPPMQALNSIAVINGHPGVYGDAALAIVKGHRDFEWIKETFDEGTMTATCEVKRRNEPAVIQTFSKADAERAGLWDERKTIPVRDGGGQRPNPAPWYCYPKRMLKFRARGFALRDAFPDALRGIKTAEELADYPGDTIEGTVQQSTPAAQVASPAAAAATERPEDTIGQIGGSAYYKLYRKNGWSPEESKAFLRDVLQIGEPHNKKDSRDIPKSEWTTDGNTGGRAFQWANTNAEVYRAAQKLFDDLGFTKEEAAKFCAEHNSDWTTITNDLKAELENRNKAEM